MISTGATHEMNQTSLPIRPEEAAKTLLKKLSSRRMRDVLEKRFGFKGGRRKTLEAIGKEYKITRERVRQIENDAMKQLSDPKNQREIEHLFKGVEDYIKHHGHVMAEHHLFSSLGNPRQAPHLSLLLHARKDIAEVPETPSMHRRWATDKKVAQNAETVVNRVVDELEKKNIPVAREELQNSVVRHAEEHLGSQPAAQVIGSYLASSKVIKENPYGEYGLVSWPTINPRGVKDKAYLVLAKSGSPMHFREVADKINRMSWSKRKAHPQTVHNELIKDPRFVLVGRGIYALNEWGYEPGTVRDVLVSVFKEAGQPMTKDEVIKRVMEKRFVKAPTILLNLQNKSVFRRSDGGKYQLV